MSTYEVWTSADGLVGIEREYDGVNDIPDKVWIRRREHPGDMWGPPEEMLLAGPFRYYVQLYPSED